MTMIAKPDGRGRVALARVIEQGRDYAVEKDQETGVVTLTPVVILADKEWGELNRKVAGE